MKMCAYCHSMHDVKACPNCGSTLAIDYRLLAAMFFAAVLATDKTRR